jgi:hypothetical protein
MSARSTTQHTKHYARLAFEAPRVGPLDVKVLDPDGNLIRIIPGAVLMKRKPQSLRETPKTAPRTLGPLVKMVRARRREERP